MRKIALLLPDLGGGGAERLSIVLAHEFARAGYAPEFALLQAKGELLAEARAAFPVHDLGSAQARAALPALARYLRQARPDGVIAAMWPLTAIAPIAARIAGLSAKVLICEHATLSQQYARWGLGHRLLLRASTFAAYRLASVRAGVSLGVCEDIAKLSGLPLSRFETIYNPIPPAAVPTPAARAAAEALWGAGGGPRILTVGSLKAQKNHALLLRAFAALPRPDARLMLLGHGDHEAALRALAAELGIAERVVFAGFHHDPGPFYAAADLFALSSDYEGFGNVIVEALFFGLRVVSTDCPAGPAEILEGGRFGRLVPMRDAPALARAIDAALDTPADRAALIRRAGDFAPDIAARRYLELLAI